MEKGVLLPPIAIREVAYITGLKESEQALVEIIKILKELESINTFMKVENPTALYKLSFTVRNADAYEAAQPEKAAKKAKDTKYTASLFCEDKEALNRFVQLYKEQHPATDS